MKILINLGSRLISEILSDYLSKDHIDYEIVIANNGAGNNNNFKPDIILADINTIHAKLFTAYPESKVALFDTGLKKEDIISAMLAYKIDGAISANMDPSFFEKALDVIRKGELWIENSTVKAMLHNGRIASRTDKANSATERENEIITHVCKGCSNKEIASKLFLSEQTIKAHLNRIFRKFNVSNRFQLITLAINNRIVPQG